MMGVIKNMAKADAAYDALKEKGKIKTLAESFIFYEAFKSGELSNSGQVGINDMISKEMQAKNLLFNYMNILNDKAQALACFNFHVNTIIELCEYKYVPYWRSVLEIGNKLF